LEEAAETPIPVVEMPSSMSKTRIDPGGRIKLGSDYLKYFDGLRERKVFVTSLDGKTADIYPISTWRETTKFLTANRKLGSARRAAFTAARLGSGCDVDSQGRVTVHAELRAELGLDNQELHVQPVNGNRIRILSAKMFEESMNECKAADTEKDADELNGAGLP
jgi:MraZ protein